MRFEVQWPVSGQRCGNCRYLALPTGGINETTVFFGKRYWQMPMGMPPVCVSVLLCRRYLGGLEKNKKTGRVKDPRSHNG